MNQSLQVTNTDTKTVEGLSASVIELRCTFCNKPLKLGSYSVRLRVKDGYGTTLVAHNKCWKKQDNLKEALGEDSE